MVRRQSPGAKKLIEMSSNYLSSAEQKQPSFSLNHQINPVENSSMETHQLTPTPLTITNSPFITAYGPKTKVLITFTTAGRTKQSFKDETDINQIMARFIRTGALEFTNKHEPRYGDTTGINFQACMDVITSAQNMFKDMPSKIRNRFDNDPAKFLDFVNDPENTEEGVKLGLLTPRKAEEATPTPPAAPAAPTTAPTAAKP